MKKALQVALKDANKAKKFLLENNLIDHSRVPDKEEGVLLFPITNDFSEKTSFEYSIIEKELPPKKELKSFKEAIKEQLNDDEIDRLKTSYDVVGDIAILEIDDDLRRKEHVIADALLETNNQIKVVLRKHGAHFGIFRTQKMKYLAGEKRKETIHKENGVLLKLDVEQVYFSTRQSTERKRIAQQVQDGERVLVLFSGCAPFPTVIAKIASPQYICGVEINPVAHKYAEENIQLNKFNNVYLLNEDAKKTEKILNGFKDIPDFDVHFDRIVMPHPTSEVSFLPEALFFAKKGTIFNFYTFSHEDKIDEVHARIKKVCMKNLLNAEILDTVKCGQHSPQTYRICVDFKVN
jgi:tRNA (guanine37-N1)-methyltransferase